jgi:hypothetical protein
MTGRVKCVLRTCPSATSPARNSRILNCRALAARSLEASGLEWEQWYELHGTALILFSPSSFFFCSPYFLHSFITCPFLFLVFSLSLFISYLSSFLFPDFFCYGFLSVFISLVFTSLVYFRLYLFHSLSPVALSLSSSCFLPFIFSSSSVRSTRSIGEIH